jgi:hypothetical protein
MYCRRPYAVFFPSIKLTHKPWLCMLGKNNKFGDTLHLNLLLFQTVAQTSSHRATAPSHAPALTGCPTTDPKAS